MPGTPTAINISNIFVKQFLFYLLIRGKTHSPKATRSSICCPVLMQGPLLPTNAVQ